MAIARSVTKPKDIRIMGIDSSSKSVAFSVVDRKNEEVHLVSHVKYDLSKMSTMAEKLDAINAFVPEVVQMFAPDKVVIEQTIYIQSPQTSRILSYIVGNIWGNCLRHCDDVVDVPILSWKANLGYKKVTKKEIAGWEYDFGKTEAKKIAASERKERVARIIKARLIAVENLQDDDIMDSIGIAIWGIDNS